MKKIYLIVAREFTERARKKSFIVTTLLMPIFMIGMMVAPSLMMLYGGSEQKQVVVIDRSGIVGHKLESSQEVVFSTQNNLDKEEACQTYNADSGIFGILFISEDVSQSGQVQFITNSSSSLMLEELISSQIKSIIEQEKLKERYNIDCAPETPGWELLQAAGKKRGYLLSRGEIDTERMAKVLVDEYRSGKLGHFTLEAPEDMQ